MARPLLLVPTRFELAMIDLKLLETRDVAVCGFGIATAGARTAQLLAEFKPTQVTLLGIAGRLGSILEIGKAYRFSEIACYGIGAGAGQNFQTASEMGWNHWDSVSRDEADTNSISPNQNITLGLQKSDSSISDVICIDECSISSEIQARYQLLTTAAASINMNDVQLKITKYPHAVAEDMEGFAVAVACQLANVQLEIIRGISNHAGDRNKSNWYAKEAMTAAANLALGSGS